MKRIFNFTTDKEEIKKLVEDHQWWEHRKIVFTNGCFDLIHSQHVNLIDESKKLGDYLIVGMNSDKSVKLLKGEGRPIIGEEDRAQMLSSLRSVDYVVIFDEFSVLDLIKFIKPDIITKGDDYKVDDLNDVGGSFVKTYGGKLELVPTRKGSSTSDIINKIKSL
jgi:D-beta-D-heptose 7-phosphate kinase/D-beta-D-heptose 1-phosphate adenosyltransferase